MPERLLCYDASLTSDEDALAVAITYEAILQHGLAPWMEEQSLAVPKGESCLLILVCAYPAHNAAHEVLTTFPGSKLSAKVVDAVTDHIPLEVEDPIKVLLAKESLTPEEKDTLLLLLGKKMMA